MAESSVTLTAADRNLLLMALWETFREVGPEAAQSDHLGPGELRVAMALTTTVRALVVKLGGDPEAQGYGASF